MIPALIRRWPLLRAGPLAAVPLTLAIALGGSVGLGLLFLILPAFGHLPALGHPGFDLAPLRAVLAYPGIGRACATTLFAGFVSTLVALGLGLGLVAVLDPLGIGARPGARWLRRVMLSLIATPHVAMAIGLAFLLAPSGWLLRLLAIPLALDRPPDFLFVNDRAGLALVLGLVVKETPFIIAVALSALHRIDGAATLRVGLSLGYQAPIAWMKILLPVLYRLIRLPIFAVLAYGLSVVDMSIVLGPGLPPTLPVLILRLIDDPDLTNRLIAAGAGLLQIALVAAAFLGWRAGELLAARLWHRAVIGGRRAVPMPIRVATQTLILGAGTLLAGLGLLALVGIALWSITDVWRFPDPLPPLVGLAAWSHAFAGITTPLRDSLLIAGTSAAIALAASIACLECEDRIGHAAGRRGQWVLFLPLFAPEMGFLFGLEIALGTIGATGTFPAVLWFHMLFVFPYVFLTLSEPWRALDPRLIRTARCLGAGRWRVLLSVKVPLLKASLALSAAVGVAVSLSLYLPTVLAGAGRVTTLATESVVLYGGGDRRVLGVYALIQVALAAAVFAAAVVAGRPRCFAGPA
ncbi:MAG TPA: hypothetical protein VMT54_08825 [Candidatus Cybelea sp.]|nr:hypothetical protein [Candidatus Cybelea sp.]